LLFLFKQIFRIFTPKIHFLLKANSPLTLDTSIEFLKGIGTERAKLIANVLDIRTVKIFFTFFR
jgi:hypothetical protein